MNNSSKRALNLSLAVLNFLANVGLVLPYMLLLLAYQKTGSSDDLLAVVLLYIVRAGSVFVTKHLPLRAPTYLLLCLAFGVMGSLLCSLNAGRITLVAGALLLGYMAATIWPYYLTVKMHLKASTGFQLRRFHWLVFLALFALVGVDLATGLSIRLSFIFLAALFASAIPAARQLQKDTQAFYATHEPQAPARLHLWPTLLFVGFFAVLGLLKLLSRVTLNVAWPYLLAVITCALFVLTFELRLAWRSAPQHKLLMVTRGFLLSNVLLVNSFYAAFVFGSKGMYLVFVLYLIGFEAGSPVVNLIAGKMHRNAKQLAQWGLLLGLLLTATAWAPFYALGLLLVAMFIGFVNPIINQVAYNNAADDPDLTIIHKYRFSTYGGLLCQVCLFALVTMTGVLTHQPLLAFFKPTSMAAAGAYQFGVLWPITLIAVAATLAVRKTESK